MCVVLGVRTSSVVVAVKIPPRNVLRLVAASVMFVFVDRAGHAAIVEQHPAFVKLGVVKSTVP
jgi:hypothetical protein